MALSDDCDACGEGELRVVVTVEEAGQAGFGLIAHLSEERRLSVGFLMAKAAEYSVPYRASEAPNA